MSEYPKVSKLGFARARVDFEVKERKMATTLAIILIALLVSGVATVTVYALPLISPASAAQAQNEDATQSEYRLHLRDCSRSGDITQFQERLRFGDCSENYVYEETCARD